MVNESTFRALSLTCLLAFVGTCSAAGAEADDDRGLLETQLAELAPEIRVGVSAFQVDGGAVFAQNADAVFPTASSIKTAILVELFARYHQALDVSPEGLDEILADEHPAVAHFPPSQRRDIRRELSDAGVRRIGRVLMGAEDASNHVYNAASNVAIALLGGPAETTRRIHQRDPAFGSIQVRRYMLTDRTVRGDNEATPEALAAVLRRLAVREVPGLDAATVEACRTAMNITDDFGRGRRFYKGGSLDSAPVTRVASGWLESDGTPSIVYVVMLAQDEPDPTAPSRLAKAVQELATASLDAIRCGQVDR